MPAGENRFRFTQRTKGLGRNGIMDLPHVTILERYSIEDCMALFERRWGHKPRAVAIPATAPDGPLLDFTQLGLPEPSAFSKSRNRYLGFEATVHHIVELGLNFYLLLDPVLPFARNNSLIVRDIVGDQSPHICIGNPISQELVAAILGTVVERCVEIANAAGRRNAFVGAVIDAVNLLPMSADEGRIEPTCFCSHCINYLGAEITHQLRSFPGPLNLALRDSGRGIGFISDLDSSMTSAQIVAISQQRGFTEIFEKRGQTAVQLDHHAQGLLAYIKKRHNQIVDATNSIFSEALDGHESVTGDGPTLRRILLTEGVPYGWTSGLELARLKRRTRYEHDGKIRFVGIDELWLSPTNLFQPEKADVPVCHYMWERAHYFIDALFSFLASLENRERLATTTLSLLPAEVVRSEARNRLNMMLAGAMAKSDLATVAGQPDSSFVGCILDKDTASGLIEGLHIPEPRGEDPATIIRKLMGIKGV